jgi:hypothetical protein
VVPRRTSLYQSQLTFFGLSLEHRKYLFDQIHQIVFHGQGGYNFADVYDMPIWLRNYTYNQIKKWYDEQNKKEDPEELTNKIKSGQVQIPEHFRGKKTAYNGGAS